MKSSSFLFGTLFAFSGYSRAFASSLSKTFIHSQPRIALIIDDIGRTSYQARQFLELGVPITYAILPRLRKTHTLAEEIHDQGHEIMLHQPMEPYESTIDPGPGALYVGDAMTRIDRIMMENISDVPFAQGVNNHMGSRFTSCEKEMNEVLQVIKSKGFFFVDSLTTNHSAAYSTAKKLEVSAARRHIFLDNCLEESAILSQLAILKNIALKNGYAVGIGHPFPETAKAVERFLDTLNDSPFSLVYISQVLS
ncbi:MAG: divergent polysaccharide deacetylase family protein [Deltaproteobacteria bacterium]|nr:divergent polysaccharide deacetylase family protein [Deltaproteobacteria bacterium]